MILRNGDFAKSPHFRILKSAFYIDFGMMFSRMYAVALGGREMSDITRVALDAMGGDHAPAEMVKGAIEAVNKRDDIKILLTGQEALLKRRYQNILIPKTGLRSFRHRK